MAKLEEGHNIYNICTQSWGTWLTVSNKYNVYKKEKR